MGLECGEGLAAVGVRFTAVGTRRGQDEGGEKNGGALHSRQAREALFSFDKAQRLKWDELRT